MIGLALPGALAEVALPSSPPAAGDASCVSVNPDPSHPLDVYECPTAGQGSNNA